MPRGIRKATRRDSRDDARGASFRRLIELLPEDLSHQALTHSSWVEHRADSYGRLGFLGDSVLGLAVAEHLLTRFARAGVGRLTKVHGQAVSGRACATVAIEIGLPDLMRGAAPGGGEGIDVEALLASERALASVCEAVIGACYLHHGFDATAEATLDAFADQIEIASETLLDFKSALQEHLAREGTRVRYSVVREAGPAHDRRFEVTVEVGDEVIGKGTGRSKKAAEQAAAAEALERLRS